MPDQRTFTKILCIAEPLGYVEIFFGDADRRACLSLTCDADGLRQMADLRDALNRFLVKQAPAPQSCLCPNGHGQMARDDGPLAPGASRGPSWKCATCGIERMWPDAGVVPAPAPQEEQEDLQGQLDRMTDSRNRMALELADANDQKERAVSALVCCQEDDLFHAHRRAAVAEDALARLTPLSDVVEQLEKAERKHAPMRGAHEGYAVLLEELDELWEEVKRQQVDASAMRKEALHVAAMALRFVKDVCVAPAPDRSLPDPKS